VERISHGDVTVTAIVDLEDAWRIDEMFPDGGTPGDRTTMAERMPGEFDGESWRIRCRCYLVRTGAATVLVDAGAGPAGSMFGGERAGRLPAVLATLGLAPADVDHVVLTHAHADHFGWSVADGRPFFGNARYHLHPADIAALRGRDDDRARRVVETLIVPLETSGQLSPIADDHDVVAGVRLRHAPGHTPGHRVVGVDTGAHQIMLAGDLLHTSYQVAHPGYDFGSDTDAALAAATRTALLAEVDARGIILAAAHLPAPFARITAGELVAVGEDRA
jgi:glyoxylase-like metal-dependent hydrolase (beta-lactamase superfamily II)